MMDWERIKPWDNVVSGVAREYSRKFTMCDANDIRQELYAWFLEHPKKLDEWEAIGHKDAKNLLYRSLRNHALDYCQKWKAKSLGYEVDDLFYYTPEMMENLLPVVLRGDTTTLPSVNHDRVSGSSTPAESGNLNTMIAEIRSGYNKLSDEDKKALFMRFSLSLDYHAIGEGMGLNSDSTARAKVKRAIRHLIILSGGYKYNPELDKEDDATSSGRQITPEETSP